MYSSHMCPQELLGLSGQKWLEIGFYITAKPEKRVVGTQSKTLGSDNFVQQSLSLGSSMLKGRKILSCCILSSSQLEI